MSEKTTLLFSCPQQPHDARMLLDRVLEPATAHPLVRDLLEALRATRLGEAHFALTEIRRHLDVEHSAIQRQLAHLMFANALHATDPEQSLQYLLDSGFDPRCSASDLMAHMALGSYAADERSSKRLFRWLMEHGGLIEPQEAPAWRALQTRHPEIFAENTSRLESQKLEEIIQSQQSVEVREVTRL